MERQGIDRDIIMPAIHSKLCSTTSGAQCYERNPTIVTQLVAKSEGMWVYTYIALQFICGGANTADMEKRLQIVLDPKETYNLSNLQLLCHTVLEHVFPPSDPHHATHNHDQLLTWIAFWQCHSGISLSMLEALSGLPINTFTSVLTKLGPMLSLGPIFGSTCPLHTPGHAILSFKEEVDEN